MGQVGNVTLRTRLSVAFDSPVVRAPQVASKLRTEFSRISSRIRQLESVSVAVDGRTAVLTGTVPTPRDRELAIRLARLEPGISVVRSELVVASGTDEDEPAESGGTAAEPTAPQPQ
jgi:hypothetical protein